MARIGVSFEEVEKAAEKIVSMGGRATVKAVRAELGTGSATTLAEHLRQWRDEKAAKADKSLLEGFSSNFQKDVAIFIKRASEELKSGIESKEMELRDEIKDLTEILKSLEGDLEKTKENYKQMERNWQYEVNKHSSVKEQLAKLVEKNETLINRVTKLEVAKGKAETASEFKDSRIAELEAEIKRLRK
jgi:DNA repair exonuclease SbcCD ATPase subunit